MVVLRRLPRRPLKLGSPAVALGIFDGVHRGHQAILKKASVAVTFHPHPLSVLHPAAAPELLMPLERRLEAFSQVGIKTALVVPFTRSFSQWSPERFVEEILVRRLKVREVVVGFNFRFGHGRRGTVKTLERLGRRHSFRVHAVAPVLSGGVRVSSGKLREWIRQGKLQKVRRLMKGPAIVAGKVVRGAGRGKGLGFATANLRVESGILPPVGVYAVRVWINKSTGYKVPGTPCFGMANLGFRPTFRREAKPLLEVHLFGLSHPLYRKRLEVEFIRRLRAERRFSSPQALARQLVVDARRAKWYSFPLNN
ncbi:MAG: riboflavin biosynthesis protein RibF [Candidatus Omnitrophota bacterium]|nr:riboflavin biosynthesis protein RibF [Candidatus Omnitrophota bacterium]